MRVPCSRLWPEADPVAATLHWSFLAGQLGADPQLPRPFMIGIRGAAPGDQETHPLVHRPIYDDAFVMLVRGADPFVFPGSTHAYQRDSKESPDETGDGRGDVGSIRCGRYLLSDPGLVHPPIFHLMNPDRTSRIPCHRDTDHDGKLSDLERAASEADRTGKQVNAAGHFATAVLFHVGFDGGRSSIACLTAPRQWIEVMRRASRPSGGLIYLVLANAWDLLPLLPEAPQPENAA